MERIIITQTAGVEETPMDETYMDALIEAVTDGTVVAITTENDWNGEVRCEVTVCRFTEPKINRVRYAMVLSGDVYELRDYANKREATSAYRAFIRLCAADGVVWSASDVPGITR